MIVVGAQLRGGDWRAFDATFHAPIRQEVDALRLDAGKQPWLVADFGTPQEAQASAISVNGQVVKPAGAPMRRWQVDGALLGWVPYAELERMGVEEEPRTWMAVPVDPQALAGARLSIEVRPPAGGATIAADHAGGDASTYDGPALDPFFTGFSLWRWIWNGHDPRIPYAQDLGGRYTSSRSDDGRYRIYVSQQPFGARTNMLQGVMPPAAGAATEGCKAGERYATTADAIAGNPWLCQESGGGIAYYDAAGHRLGASAPARPGPAGAARHGDR